MNDITDTDGENPAKWAWFVSPTNGGGYAHVSRCPVCADTLWVHDLDPFGDRLNINKTLATAIRQHACSQALDLEAIIAAMDDDDEDDDDEITVNRHQKVVSAPPWDEGKLRKHFPGHVVDKVINARAYGFAEPTEGNLHYMPRN